MNFLKQYKQNEILIILCIQTLVNNMGVGIVSPILPQYARMYGVSIAMVGMVITVFGLARLTADIPAGRLSSKLGCRPILIIGPVISCISSFGCVLAADYWLFLVFRFFQGIGSAVFNTAGMVALAQISTPKDRGRVMGLYQGCFLIGIGTGPLVGGFVADSLGLQAPFYFYAGLTALAAIWGYFTMPRNISANKCDESDIEVPGSKPHEGIMSRGSLKSLFSNFNFVLISMLCFGIFFIRNAGQNQILPLIGVERLGIDEGQIGVSMTVIIIAQIITTFTIFRASSKFGKKRVITAGCLVFALSLVILAISGNYLIFLLSCVVGGLGAGISGPAPVAYATDVMAKNNYGLGIGIYRMVGDLGMVMGPIITGWLADKWGFDVALISIAIFFMVITMLFQGLAKDSS